MRPDLLPVVLRRLGFRVIPAGSLPPEQFGPPAPATITPIRRKRQADLIAAEVVPLAGPFAALAALRR